MQLYSKKLRQFLRNVPGGSKYGIYRFLPVFFIVGAALEFVMINWRVGNVNFYRTFKKRQVEEIVEQRLRQEQENLSASTI